MGRKAKIIGCILDMYGDGWDVKEFRPTPFNWQIAVGWPSGYPRGRGGIGGPRVILTTELAARLESVRQELVPMKAANLPLGRFQLKRLRRLLGHNRKSDRRAWWVEKAEELASTGFTDFGKKYGVSSSAAELMHIELFGENRGRPTAWWRQDGVRELLNGDLPTIEIADRLGRSCQEVWGGRYLLKHATTTG